MAARSAPNGAAPNRVAVVTGASRRRGIGAAVAAALAADGVDLLLVHFEGADDETGIRDPLGIEGVLEAVRAAAAEGVRLEPFACDLARPDAAARVFDAAERALGPVSVLVNNAALSLLGGIDELDADAIDRHLAVNARAPMLLTRELLARLPGRWGRVVNLTSGQGAGPMPRELAYASSKGALEAFTTNVASVAAARGVTVNAVDPGATDSGWMSEAERRALVAPAGRLGEPADAARLIRWLCGDEAGWVTGQVIRSRGGL